jgi:hypothetical protein
MLDSQGSKHALSGCLQQPAVQFVKHKSTCLQAIKPRRCSHMVAWHMSMHTNTFTQQQPTADAHPCIRAKSSCCHMAEGKGSTSGIARDMLTG